MLIQYLNNISLILLAFPISLLPHACKMAAVAPDITLIFKAATSFLLIEVLPVVLILVFPLDPVSQNQNIWQLLQQGSWEAGE